MVECDMKEAVQKAEEFLKERHTTTNLESSRLEGDVWHIVFDVGFLTRQMKEIKINALSGKIIEYVGIDTNDENKDGD